MLSETMTRSLHPDAIAADHGALPAQMLRCRPKHRLVLPGYRKAMMTSPNRIAEVAALVGEPARAAMLTALLDGRALTASELASVAGITPQTASSHLARLTDAAFLKVEKQGRHRYHRLAGPDIASTLEGLMQLSVNRVQPPGRTLRVGPRDERMRAARTCYDHLAGRLGVAIADALIAERAVEFDEDAGLITDAGLSLLQGIGIPLCGDAAKPSRRAICKPCLDWSERRPHLAGRLGAAICSHAFSEHWVRRLDGTRALELTPKGRQALKSLFGISRGL
jgi:DNA-binding transcriptional ArsR family regulator